MSSSQSLPRPRPRASRHSQRPARGPQRLPLQGAPKVDRDGRVRVVATRDHRLQRVLDEVERAVVPHEPRLCGHACAPGLHEHIGRNANGGPRLRRVSLVRARQLVEEHCVFFVVQDDVYVRCQPEWVVREWLAMPHRVPTRNPDDFDPNLEMERASQ